MEEENMRTGERHHCCSAYLTFVVASCNGKGLFAGRRRGSGLGYCSDIKLTEQRTSLPSISFFYSAAFLQRSTPAQQHHDF